MKVMVLLLSFQFRFYLHLYQVVSSHYPTYLSTYYHHIDYYLLCPLNSNSIYYYAFLFNDIVLKVHSHYRLFYFHLFYVVSYLLTFSLFEKCGQQNFRISLLLFFIGQTLIEQTKLLVIFGHSLFQKQLDFQESLKYLYI